MDVLKYFTLSPTFQPYNMRIHKYTLRIWEYILINYAQLFLRYHRMKTCGRVQSTWYLNKIYLIAYQLIEFSRMCKISSEQCSPDTVLTRTYPGKREENRVKVITYPLHKLLTDIFCRNVKLPSVISALTYGRVKCALVTFAVENQEVLWCGRKLTEIWILKLWEFSVSG